MMIGRGRLIRECGRSGVELVPQGRALNIPLAFLPLTERRSAAPPRNASKARSLQMKAVNLERATRWLRRRAADFLEDRRRQ
jgi:hypothetical protein